MLGTRSFWIPVSTRKDHIFVCTHLHYHVQLHTRPTPPRSYLSYLSIIVSFWDRRAQIHFLDTHTHSHPLPLIYHVYGEKRQNEIAFSAFAKAPEIGIRLFFAPSFIDLLLLLLFFFSGGGNEHFGEDTQGWKARNQSESRIGMRDHLVRENVFILKISLKFNRNSVKYDCKKRLFSEIGEKNSITFIIVQIM